MKVFKKNSLLVLLSVMYLTSCSASAKLPPYRFQLPTDPPQETANREDRKSSFKTQFPYPFAAGNGSGDGLLEGGDLHQRFAFEMRLLTAARQNKIRIARHHQVDRTKSDGIQVKPAFTTAMSEKGMGDSEKFVATGRNFTPPIFRDIPEMVLGESRKMSANPMESLFSRDKASETGSDNHVQGTIRVDEAQESNKPANMEKITQKNATSDRMKINFYNKTSVGESTTRKHTKEVEALSDPSKLAVKTFHLPVADKENTTLGTTNEPYGVKLKADNAKKFLQIINSGLMVKDTYGGPKALQTADNTGHLYNELLLKLVDKLKGHESDRDETDKGSRKSKIFKGSRDGLNSKAEVNAEDLTGNFSAALYSCLMDWAFTYEGFTCAQDRFTTVINDALAAEKIYIFPGISLTRHGVSGTDKSADKNQMKLKEVMPVGDWLGNMLQKIGTFFRVFSLDVSLGDLDLDLEGRGHHHYRRVFPIVVTTYMIMSTFLIPMGFQFMAMLGGKALVLSKLAFLWSLFGVSRRIFPYSYPEGYAPPHHDFHQPGLYRAAHRKDHIPQ